MKIKQLFRLVGKGGRLFSNNFPAPLVLGWAITDICGRHCEYCDIPSRGLKGPSPKQAQRIIELCGHSGILQVSLTGGEPMLRDDFPEIVKKIKAHGMRITVNTAGGPEKRWPNSLLSTIDTAFISLDGPPHIHDKIRGKGGFFQAINALKRFSSLGVPVITSTVVGDDNVKYLQYVLEKSASFGARAAFDPPSPHLLAGTLKPTGKKNIKKAFYNMGNHLFSKKVLSGLIEQKPPKNCLAGKWFAFLDADNRLYPCFDLRGKKGGLNILRDGFSPSLKAIAPPHDCESCYCGKARSLATLNDFDIIQWISLLKWI